MISFNRTVTRFELIAAVVIASFSRAGSAPPQDPPLEWGVVPDSDLAMTTFLPDTSAPAMILCDYGETVLANSLDLEFRRHTRIKILSRSGYDWGTHSFLLYSHKKDETAKDIEGVTYSRGAGGQVVRTEMDEKSIFKEQVNEYYTRYRFTLPALTPGCVIEFRYTIKSKIWELIRNWVFQERIPVRWSEYRVMMPHLIAFAAVSNKRFPFAVDENTETHHTWSGDAKSYVGGDRVKCYRYRWVIRNSPALSDEPFVTRVMDYAQKMDLTLAEYAHGGDLGNESVSKTWDDVINGLLKEEEFGKRTDVSSPVRRLADLVTAGLVSPEDKLNAIYNCVRTTIVWTGYRGIYAVREPDQVIEGKKGSVSEIAFLLLSMLKSAGIDADPVILSTRSNGMIQMTYPAVGQFNWVVVRARVGGKSCFLDATDPLRPIELLPTDVQKVGGLVIKEGPVEWCSVNCGRIYSRRSIARITLKEGGEIEGVLESSDEQYGALAKRREFRDAKAVEIARNAFDADRSGSVLDSVTVEGGDSVAQPFRIRARVASGSYAQASGDFLYMNPAVIERQFTNPFKSETRSYPVNMSAGSRLTSVVDIALPAGYDVSEVPKDQNIRLNGNDAVFTRLVQIDGPVVQFVTNLFINRTDYLPDAYSDLRKFYEKVTAAQSEQMVLRRKPPAALKVAPAAKSKAGAMVRR
jgi:hypothetical protein